MYTSKQDKITKENPPEMYFEGKDLRMAQAIYKEDVKTIEYLIKQEHYDVNGRGSIIDTAWSPNPIRYTYLNYAVMTGKIKSVEKLLALRADINLTADEQGGGAYNANINIACYNDNKEMIRLLVRYKENLNPELSESPINTLLRNGNVDRSMIDLLLQNGADINHKEYFSGDMPILTAIAIGKYDYVNYFLDKGANPVASDYNGTTLAWSLQHDIWMGTLTDQGLKETLKIKDRLINQFHIKFPVKAEIKKAIEENIQRYESLSQADKELLGEVEGKRIEELKDSLSKGVTVFGKSIDSLEEASMQPPANYKE